MPWYFLEINRANKFYCTGSAEESGQNSFMFAVTLSHGDVDKRVTNIIVFSFVFFFIGFSFILLFQYFMIIAALVIMCMPCRLFVYGRMESIGIIFSVAIIAVTSPPKTIEFTHINYMHTLRTLYFIHKL